MPENVSVTSRHHLENEKFVDERAEYICFPTGENRSGSSLKVIMAPTADLTSFMSIVFLAESGGGGVGGGGLGKGEGGGGGLSNKT